MLGKEVEAKADSGSSDSFPSQAGGSTAHLGLKDLKRACQDLVSWGSILGKGKTLGGQAELRKVKRAMSDNSPVSGSPRTRLVISSSLVLNLIQSSLAQQLSDKLEPQVCLRKQTPNSGENRLAENTGRPERTQTKRMNVGPGTAQRI